MGGVRDKTAEPSPSHVVLLLELRGAASCLIMRKHTVLHVNVNQRHREPARNIHSRVLLLMSETLWQQGPALSVATSPALWSHHRSSQAHSLPSEVL